MVDFRQPEMLLFLVATIGVTPSAEETSWYNWTGFWLPWSTVPGKPTDILFFSPTWWHHIGTEFYNSHENIAFAVLCWITVLCGCGSQTNRKRYALIWQLCFELCFALLCFDEVCCQQCEDKLPWRSELAAQCHVLVPTQEKLTSFLAARENLGSLIVLVLRSFELFWCILSGYECPTTTTKI